MNDEAFNLIKGSLSQRNPTVNPRARVEPTQQEKDELFAERITLETKLPPMQPLFRMFDVPCFYRGELVADCGRAKSGKTFFLSILMSACLTQKALALERLIDSGEDTESKPLRVLWLDTEQSQQSTQEIMKERVIPLARWPTGDCKETSSGLPLPPDINDYFYAFNLRGLGYERRGKMVDVAIRTIKPDICIIDGVKDLMTDINDAVQATLIMEKLMALAQEHNCCIVCVLHLNKSEQDRNMRGSIGTELTNKAFEVFQCEVIDESNTFKVTHTYSRKQKMTKKLFYRINDEGLPEACGEYLEKPRDKYGRWTSAVPQSQTEFDLKDLFTTAMEGRTQRPYAEVMAVALKKCSVLDAKTYYAYFDNAEKLGIIHKAEHPETGETWVELLDNPLPF